MLTVNGIKNIVIYAGYACVGLFQSIAFFLMPEKKSIAPSVINKGDVPACGIATSIGVIKIAKRKYIPVNAAESPTIKIELLLIILQIFRSNQKD